MNRDKALLFLDSISVNLESNDPHALIEKNVREQIAALDNNVQELEKQKETALKEESGLKPKD